MPTGNHHLSNQVGPRVCATITQEGQSQQQYWQKVSFSSEKKRQGRGAEDNLKLPKVEGGKFILPAPVPASPSQVLPLVNLTSPDWQSTAYVAFPMFWIVAEWYLSISNNLILYSCVVHSIPHKLIQHFWFWLDLQINCIMILISNCSQDFLSIFLSCQKGKEMGKKWKKAHPSAFICDTAHFCFFCLKAVLFLFLAAAQKIHSATLTAGTDQPILACP